MASKYLLRGADGGDAEVVGNHSTARGGDAGQAADAPGGPGGNASVNGHNSHAVGGRGGRGGIGPGSPGGDAHVVGDNAGYFGGEGGEANQVDGRGGRGGVAHGLELFGYSERRARMKIPYGEVNDFPGRGGDSPDTLQHMARRLIVEDLKLRYFIKHDLAIGDPHHIWYDRDEVPLSWINEQLEIDGHRWRATVEADEYVFVDYTLSRWRRWYRLLTARIAALTKRRD